MWGKITALIRVLREQDPIKAARIEDQFSFVLQGIEADEIKDKEMVVWLFEAITEAVEMSHKSSVVISETCATCEGAKFVNGRACALCGGTGQRQRAMKLEELVRMVARELRSRPV